MNRMTAHLNDGRITIVEHHTYPDPDTTVIEEYDFRGPVSEALHFLARKGWHTHYRPGSFFAYPGYGRSDLSVEIEFVALAPAAYLHTVLVGHSMGETIDNFKRGTRIYMDDPADWIRVAHALAAQNWCASTEERAIVAYQTYYRIDGLEAISRLFYKNGKPRRGGNLESWERLGRITLKDEGIETIVNGRYTLASETDPFCSDLNDDALLGACADLN